MKRLGFLLLFAFGATALLAAEKPNILVIYSDDHGWADIGSQGADPDVRTPNLDQLVNDGVLFKRGYVTAPQCTPSRAGLISGRYQNRFGVEHNGISMPLSVVTLPERLKTAGYVTGMSGKWHLDIVERSKERGRKGGTVIELAPQAQGFDEYFSGFLHDYSASHGLDGKPFPDAPHLVSDPRCRVVIQTEAALAFLRRREANASQPWFHYLAYMAPHVPLESAEPWFSRTPQHLPKERRQALSLIAAIDDGIGRIREQLRKMGQEKNTLIFFIGDNGAPLGNSWDGSINLPMRGQKGMLSEGGIRVPFLAAWPGKIPGGQKYDFPVHSLDVAATAAAIAAVEDRSGLEGVNLLPHLTGENKAAPHETLYWRWMSQAAIQEFPYKLIALGGNGNYLFDVTTPEGEAMERNLIQKEPEIAARLEAKLKAWTAELQPPGMPPPLADRHVQLFAEHGITAKAAAPPAPNAAQATEGSIQGWICRNGTITAENGALVIKPETGAGRSFITNSALDLAGPVTARLRLRSREKVGGAITWRTRSASFTPAQTAAFEWSGAAEWTEATVELPETDRILHIRITSAKAVSGLEIQSIELRDKNGKTQSWKF